MADYSHSTQAGQNVTGSAQTFAGAKTFSTGIVGKTDGAVVAAGYIGERLAPVTETFSVAVASTGTVVNLNSMTLTPGVWLVTGIASIPLGTYSAFVYGTLAISTSSASVAATTTREGFTQWTDIPNGGAGHAKSCSRYLNVSVNTTIYLVARAGATSGSANWADMDGRSIQAIRIA